VEKVERVEVAQGQARVRLSYRQPVLAVWYFPDTQPGRINGSPRARAVDQHGILLPAPAPVVGLLDLLGDAPAGPGGALWGDPTVEAAARTAGYLRPYQDRLHLASCEARDGNLTLTNVPFWEALFEKQTTTTHILWGHAPGEEQPDEAPAAEKVKRLLDYCDQHGSLGTEQEPIEHDVRPRDRAIHRRLMPTG
jgi:hypothetical protein